MNKVHNTHTPHTHRNTEYTLSPTVCLPVCLTDCKGNQLLRTEDNIIAFKECIDGKHQLAENSFSWSMWECVLTVCVSSGFCISGRGLNYAGNVNISKSGRQCQHWKHSFPHPIIRCRKCLFPSNFKEFCLDQILITEAPLSRDETIVQLIEKMLTSNMLRHYPPTHSSLDAYPGLGWCSLASP